jgi:dipeptidyl aminopeptidase/acylaminoacyl peptidase
MIEAGGGPDKARFRTKEALMPTRFAHRGLVAAGILVLLAVSAGPAQTTAEAPFKMTIENIMRGNDLVGTEPSAVGWSVDGTRLYFRWKKPTEKQAEPYYVAKPDLVPKKTTAEEMQRVPMLPTGGGRGGGMGFFGGGGGLDLSKDRKRALTNQGGDIGLLDLATGKTTPIVTTEARESNVRFAGGDRKIAFQSGDNLFLLSLEDRSLSQMTSFARRPAQAGPPARKPDEVGKWYTDQQLELFEQFKQGLDRGGARGGGMLMGMGQRGRGPGQTAASRRRPTILEENQSVVGLELSPDEKFVFFTLTEPVPNERGTIVPSYVTRSGFTEDINGRAKAGYASRTSKAGIMDPATGEVKWIDYGQPGRPIRPGGVYWSPDGKTCVVSARSEDRKDAWLLVLDPATAKTTVVEQVHDDAWVGDLGLANVFWWPDGRSLSYISEKDGFAHLYKASIDGAAKAQLTSGRFEVRDARLSKDGKRIYLTSSEAHPGETHFYAMPAAGGPRTKISGLPGLNEFFLSPDETLLAFLHSEATKPAELYLQPMSPGATAKALTLSTTDEFRSYAWAEPEVLSFKARDGFDVYARVYMPKNPHPKHPGVVFIHGAGYLQNAHKGWSSYFHEYMFHNFLLEQGYVVMDADYRGSSGYGRDCRTGIYRDMGGKDLDDVVDAAKYLAANRGVDPARIGCYGGSYGGFLTLMAMFKAPGVFRAGAALRPVTDWAAYSNGYTVDILNLPQKDPEAYKRSSPIYFAEGLQGALLICHGVVDTNVHFQDTVRLVQRLIELGKENWEAAMYPVENHGFVNAASWTDEYKRIFKLFEANLKYN